MGRGRFYCWGADPDGTEVRLGRISQFARLSNSGQNGQKPAPFDFGGNPCWGFELVNLATGVKQSLGIFGTSVAGTWAGSCLDFAHDYWVDEDPSRLGMTWMNKEIVPLSQVNVEDLVVVALAPIKVQSILKRLRSDSKTLNLLSPPLLHTF